jgi:hypothetical protein
MADAEHARTGTIGWIDLTVFCPAPKDDPATSSSS